MNSAIWAVLGKISETTEIQLSVDLRPLWGLFGPYKETNVRLLSLRGPLRETNLCVNAKSVPGTPRIIYIPLLK